MSDDLTDEQRALLSHLIHCALIDIRRLANSGKAEQAGHLADIMESLPRELFGIEGFVFCWKLLQSLFKGYQKKWVDPFGMDFVSRSAAIRGLNPPDTYGIRAILSIPSRSFLRVKEVQKHTSDTKLTEKQRESLSDLVHRALVSIRSLGYRGESEKIACLADIVESLPLVIFGMGEFTFDLALLQSQFEDYQKKYPDSIIYNFISMIAAIRELDLSEEFRAVSGILP